MTDVKAGVDRAALLKDLKRQVAALEDDLRARTESVDEIRVRLEAEYRQAREARRTAAPYKAWREERVTQSAAAWVLACVFVRFCEDNGLIDEPFIAGPGERLAEAEARHEAFFRDNPTKNNRDWLLAAFHALAARERHGRRPLRRGPQPPVGHHPRRTRRRPSCCRSGGGGARRARSATTSPTRSGTPASSATSTRT